MTRPCIMLGANQIVCFSEGLGIDRLLHNVFAGCGDCDVYQYPDRLGDSPKFIGRAKLIETENKKAPEPKP